MIIDLKNYKVVSSKEIINIITSPENIELSRINYKKISYKVQNEIFFKNKQELSPIYELITDLSYSVDSNYPIFKKTIPPFLMRSFKSTFYIIFPLLLFLIITHNFISSGANEFPWMAPVITLTGTLFFGFFDKVRKQHRLRA